LAQALLPLAAQEPLKAALDTYEATLNSRYTDLMCEKLGLQQRFQDDGTLVTDLLTILQANHIDYTNFFRALADFQSSLEADNEPLQDFFVDRAAFDAWALRYRERLQAEGSDDLERKPRMNQVNPKYILRNYLAQNAISLATEKDYSEIDRLLALLRDPYAEQPEMETYAAAPPNWGKHIIVSCSS
jgi:uncharacterized protein YdiU (UPF0061 family)